MIKTIIFDCFGVVFKDNFGPVYEYFGGNLEKDKEFISNVIHQGNSGKIHSGMQQIVDHLGVSLDEWNAKRNELDNAGLDYDLLKFIKILKKNYKVGMLSNVGSGGLGRYIDYSILNEHFEVIIESAKIGFAKPEARAYEIAAEKIGSRLDECLFVDDRQEYIEGAVAVGMRTYLFLDTQQLIKDFSDLIKSTQKM